MAGLIIPVADQFNARVTYRGTAILQTIIERFTTLDLLERAKASPLGQFFKAAPLKFSGALFHQLMLMKIESKHPKEAHFKLGATLARFSVIEFALVTGLNFCETPSEEQLTERLSSDRLINDYFNGECKVKLIKLEDAFKDCKDPADVFKLGLCLLVEGVLLATERTNYIGINILRMVEDEEYFFKYPWGKGSFKRLMISIQKDVTQMVKKVEEKKMENKAKYYEFKYTVYGYAPALLYWAYEAVFEVGKQFALKSGINLFPRMLRWSAKYDVVPTREQCVVMFNRQRLTVLSVLNPKSSEVEYIKSLTDVDVSEVVDLPLDADNEEPEREAEAVAVAVKKAGVFYEPLPLPTEEQAPAATIAAPSDHPDYQLLVKRIDRVEKQQEMILKNLEDMFKDQEATVTNNKVMMEHLGKIQAIFELRQLRKHPELSKSDKKNSDHQEQQFEYTHVPSPKEHEDTTRSPTYAAVQSPMSSQGDIQPSERRVRLKRVGPYGRSPWTNPLKKKARMHEVVPTPTSPSSDVEGENIVSGMTN